jgi:hypothetical protein
MREFLYMTRKRSVHLLGACVLLGGGIAVPVLLGAVGAQAAACGTVTAEGAGGCTLTGSADLGAGVLTLTSPASLGWTGTVGVDQALVDATTADEGYTVDDATGSGDGWDVTVTATTFTSTTPTAATLPDTGTFQTNGSVTDVTGITGEADTTDPTAACAATTTCTLPTNTTVFPVLITTGGLLTAYTIYNAPAAAAGTGGVGVVAANGLGSIVLGGSTAANPVGWWLNVPATALTGTYTSTITMAVITAP